MKMTYADADAKTRPFFINFITKNLCEHPIDCSESDHSLSDALSKWYRTTSFEVNALLVAFMNSDASGYSAGNWYGMHRVYFDSALGRSIRHGLRMGPIPPAIGTGPGGCWEDLGQQRPS